MKGLIRLLVPLLILSMELALAQSNQQLNGGETNSILNTIDNKIEILKTKKNSAKHNSADNLETWLKKLRVSITSGFPPEYIAPKNPIPKTLSGTIIFVTHARLYWDSFGSARSGIDRFLSWQKKRDPSSKVVYLMESSSPSYSIEWYTSNRKPDVALVSQKSEAHPFVIDSENVYFLGGGFGSCQLSTVDRTIRQHLSNEPLNLHFPMSGTYSFDKTIEEIWKEKGDLRFFRQDIERAFYINREKQEFLFKDLDEPSQLDLKQDYRLHFYIDNKQIDTIGTGIKEINFYFWSSKKLAI
ncbi:MAG: hypothetical protein ACXVB4_19320 [Pseudobdellovibrionaceae bacterium]